MGFDRATIGVLALRTMTSKLACIACVAALAAPLAACGGSSKGKSTSDATTSTSTTSSSADKTQAKTALAKWVTLTPKLNAAFKKYGKDEPAHAHKHDVYAVRRDAYDLRNAVYRFDISIRKIKFPTSVQTDVNSVLDTTKKIVAALDGVSQSGKVATIDRNVRKANGELKPLERTTGKVNDELHRLAAG